MYLKKISVIIPAYNSNEHIIPCLNSLEAQTFTDFEIILINDGSTDLTDKKIHEYLNKTHLTILYYSQENHGQAYCRNRGIDIASGKYIAFIDSDDLIESDYLEQLYLTAENYNADIVNCGYKTQTENGTILSSVSVSPFAPVTDFGRTGIFVVWAKLFRTSFLRKYNIKFPEQKLYEDVPFSITAKYHASCVKSINYIGYYYIQHTNSTMHNSRIQTTMFPFDELNTVLSELQTLSHTSHDALEFELLHFFTGFLFLYCRKLPAKELFHLCTYTQDILKNHFPYYIKNPYLGLTRSKELPLFYRIAILIFVFSNRIHLLKPISWLLTRI